jgi:glycine/serine hydroxymethyltransferase
MQSRRQVGRQALADRRAAQLETLAQTEQAKEIRSLFGTPSANPAQLTCATVAGPASGSQAGAAAMTACMNPGSTTPTCRQQQQQHMHTKVEPRMMHKTQAI